MGRGGQGRRLRSRKSISLLMMINTQTAGLTPLVTASVDTQHAAGTAEVYRDNIMNHD